MIVEHVAGDEDKLDLMFHGLGSELFDSREAGFADSVAGAFLEARDAQTEVKVGGVQESDHLMTPV